VLPTEKRKFAGLFIKTGIRGRGGSGRIFFGSGFIPMPWDFAGLKNSLNKPGLSPAWDPAFLNK
jgi:hypothetical protein